MLYQAHVAIAHSNKYGLRWCRAHMLMHNVWKDLSCAVLLYDQTES